MSDLLTPDEDRNVRLVITHLRARFGSLALLAEAISVRPDALWKDAPISPNLVFKLARCAQQPVGDLLEGRFPGKHVCRHCGHPFDADQIERVS